ncbi:hypothetical protein ACXZ1K_04050 [Pedobacter sp. PWIIR3]
MDLKEIVDTLLKEKKLTKRWLAAKVKMQPDGFRLALKNHSIKFDELSRMSEALEVSPSTFFSATLKEYENKNLNNSVLETDENRLYLESSSKNEVRSIKTQNKKLKEEVLILKEQLQDKSKIIKLLEDKVK